MNHSKVVTSARGFTLVELIVVITILVILGTIAFLNLGGMSATARDSQRTSDLNQISTQIMVAQAKQGIAYTTMLSGTVANTLTGANNLGGTGITSTNYLGGDVNYTVLGIDSTKFSDPVSKVAYKMGATSIAGGSYELATKLEESQIALVMGTFKSRNSQTAGTITSTGANNTILLSNDDIGKFFVNDIVGNGAYTGTINKVVVNGAAGVSISLTVTPTTT
ncbi:MAG: type II secretion system protein, partial [Candidatus Gracilibacteria bacterium]